MWKIRRGGKGGYRFLEKMENLGRWGILSEFPSVVGVWIFSGTTHYISTWIFENQVPLGKGMGVFLVVFVVQKLCLGYVNTSASLFFLLFSLPFAFLSVVCDFRVIRGHKIFISHVLKNSGTYFKQML